MVRSNDRPTDPTTDVVVSTRSRRESYAMHVRRMRRAREALSSRAAADLLLTRGVKLLVECSDLLPVDLYLYLC